MAAQRSITKLGCSKLYSLLVPLLLSLLIWTPSFSFAAINTDDVAAINGLFAAFGALILPGWIAFGGDPCGEAWQGILCNGSDIISITVNAPNLEGELGDNLAKFTSIRGIDFSNNHIGGSIPPNFPVTLQHLFLSANQFTGTIPKSSSFHLQGSSNATEFKGMRSRGTQNLVLWLRRKHSLKLTSGTELPGKQQRPRLKKQTL